MYSRYINQQLLDEVFVIRGIIKVGVRVISRDEGLIAAERQRSSSLIWKFYSTQSFRVSIQSKSRFVSVSFSRGVFLRFEGER